MFYAYVESPPLNRFRLSLACLEILSRLSTVQIFALIGWGDFQVITGVQSAYALLCNRSAGVATSLTQISNSNF